MQQPREGHVGRLLAQLLAQVLVGGELVPVRLDRQLRPAGDPTTALALGLEHAAEQPAAERGPGDQADAVGLRGGQHLELDRPADQVVERLLADRAAEAAGPRGLIGPGDVPAREVGRADVDDLALRDQHLHRLPDLVPRGVPVDVVHLVQVDVVGPQPLQRGVAGAADVQRRQLALVRPRAHAAVELGRQHGSLAPAAAAGEPVADDLLGPADVPGRLVGGLARPRRRRCRTGSRCRRS